MAETKVLDTTSILNRLGFVSSVVFPHVGKRGDLIVACREGVSFKVVARCRHFISLVLSPAPWY